MQDWSQIAEILYRMQSDYIPEHTAAAEEFIQKGFPTAVLFSLVEKTRQPNLVSMYFYMSGKRTDGETIEAWQYLRQRFEGNPEKFVAERYDPNLLSGEYGSLLFAARKYLLVKGKIQLFDTYFDIIERKAMPLLPNGIPPLSHNDSPFILFYKWLRRFFYVYIPLTPQTVRAPKRTKDSGPSIDGIKGAFQKMRDIVLNFSFENYFIEAKRITYQEGTRTLCGRPYFFDVPCPYYDAVDELMDVDSQKDQIWSIRRLLKECDDIDFRIDMLNRVEQTILLKHSRDRQAYEASVVSTNLYLYFEQNVYNMGYNVNCCNNLFYNLEKDAGFYEPFLLPYLVEDAFFDIGSKREAQGYMALDTLMSAKSFEAYSFVRQLLLSEKSDKLAPPSSNYWDFILRQFYNELYLGNYKERSPDDIGYDWEDLCQRIAKTSYNDVLTNHEGTCLDNGTIPDIVVGARRYNAYGKITHVSRIIECKKSLYFVYEGTVLNNNTTYKYYDFCDRLEYWILEEKDDRFAESDIAQFPKLKCIFASELLNAPWLSETFKKEIRILLEEISRQKANPSDNIATISELCQAIDHLIEFPPPDIPTRPQRASKKKPRLNPTTVIRQYAMDGTFLKEFETAQYAASETGLRIDAITNVTSGRRNSAGGFLWKKCPIGSPSENIIPPKTTLDLEGKNILQVNQTGEAIATYETLGQAEKLSGVNRRSISDALKGIQKTAGGFTWVLTDKSTTD